MLRLTPPPCPFVAEAEFIEGFPSRIEGECVLCLDDNINTDGIYPGKYTYREDITDLEQAQARHLAATGCFVISASCQLSGRDGEL